MHAIPTSPMQTSVLAVYIFKLTDVLEKKCNLAATCACTALRILRLNLPLLKLKTRFLIDIFLCIIGSAEALPILCVSDFCERQRERDACDVIDITLKSRVIMHMITSTARMHRPNASTRSDSEPVERWNLEVHDCKDKELGA